KVGAGAEGIQKRFQGGDIVGPGRNIEALVTAEARHHQGRVIAPRSGMDLQNQPVVQTHPRHLSKHLRTEKATLAFIRPSHAYAAEKSFSFRRGEIGGLRGRMSVVARCRAELPEVGAAAAMGVEIAAPASGVATCDLSQP